MAHYDEPGSFEAQFPAELESVVASRRMVAAALQSLSCIALAQESYPSRPIRLIVGFTPGAASDVVARFFAKGAAPIIGQQVVVENKPGGRFQYRCQIRSTFRQ